MDKKAKGISGIKKRNRYDTSTLIEAQFEPGSRGRVLKNLLGIKSRQEMDRVEEQEQIRALNELIKIYDQKHCFTAGDVCRIHKVWLGPVYPWAGQYRQVNLIKGDFPFAATRQVPQLMDGLEKGLLKEFTPCNFTSQEKVIKALAVVHTELVLIHPFRDGNGRVARLLSILMGLQAGLPPLDFGGIKGQKRKEYFAAVQAGLERDYQPMEKVFSAVVCKALQVREG